ncbi:uncharacterized protein LOC103782674 [Pan paniscus]|uniref:uncharacterized protein LOC103782674 n=1 Tax=Pan paniscus TaxID=9597 RepID=UPI003005257F
MVFSSENCPTYEQQSRTEIQVLSYLLSKSELSICLCLAGGTLRGPQSCLSVYLLILLTYELSLRGRQRAHSKLANKPVVQPVEEQEPKGPQASEERNLEPPSSEQLEPTVTFLFTLLNTSEPTEPKDPESDSEIQEYQFLDQEDWGPQRTSKEIRQLQNDCMRLQESLNTTQVHNLALGEKLQNLPTLLYKSLKEGAQAIQEEAQAIQDEVKALQEESQALLEVALLRETTAKRMEIQGCLSVFTTWRPGGHVTLQAHPGARVQAQKKQRVSKK